MIADDSPHNNLSREPARYTVFGAPSICAPNIFLLWLSSSEVRSQATEFTLCLFGTGRLLGAAVTEPLKALGTEPDALNPTVITTTGEAGILTTETVTIPTPRTIIASASGWVEPFANGEIACGFISPGFGPCVDGTSTANSGPPTPQHYTATLGFNINAQFDFSPSSTSNANPDQNTTGKPVLGAIVGGAVRGLVALRIGVKALIAFPMAILSSSALESFRSIPRLKWKQARLVLALLPSARGKFVMGGHQPPFMFNINLHVQAIHRTMEQINDRLRRLEAKGSVCHEEPRRATSAICVVEGAPMYNLGIWYLWDDMRPMRPLYVKFEGVRRSEAVGVFNQDTGDNSLLLYPEASNKATSRPGVAHLATGIANHPCMLRTDNLVVGFGTTPCVSSHDNGALPVRRSGLSGLLPQTTKFQSGIHQEIFFEGLLEGLRGGGGGGVYYCGGPNKEQAGTVPTYIASRMYARPDRCGNLATSVIGPPFNIKGSQRDTGTQSLAGSIESSFRVSAVSNAGIDALSMTVPSVSINPAESSPHAFAKQWCFTMAVISERSGILGVVHDAQQALLGLDDDDDETSVVPRASVDDGSARVLPECRFRTEHQHPGLQQEIQFLMMVVRGEGVGRSHLLQLDMFRYVLWSHLGRN
ncbi:hypothetical protein FB451DRAFT_1534683 [Mycena latifolia]|nr:hypothetical protein FB451DRAFT_1534683 [Mycena latifolia]